MERMIDLALLRLDGGTQARAHVDDAVLEDFTEALVAGARFPAVVAFFDGTNHWLADGFYRVGSHKRAAKKQILADVRDGAKRDAILYAVGANAEHGSRRTPEDKRRSVQMLLADEEWAKKSDRWIAEQAKVSNHFVERCRHKSMTDNTNGSTGNVPSSKRVGKDGKARAKPDKKRKPLDIIREWAASGLLGKQAARELEILSKRQQKDFVALVSEGATPADALKRVGREPGNDRPPPPPPKKDPPRGQVLDRLGNAVPDHLRDAFADPGLANLIEELEQVEAMIRPEPWLDRAGKLCDHYGFILIDKFKEHAWEAIRELQLALESLRAGVPHAVCPKCKGTDSKKDGKTCRGCRGYGAVPSHRFGELTEAS